MFLTYMGEVLKRAFTPTPRLTDGLQIAAASALPAAAQFAGVDLPQSAEGSVLAYIGLVALCLFIIRFFWAPYAMWKEQNAQVASLRLELSKPERIEFERMSKLRAKSKMKLAARLREYYWLSCQRSDAEKASAKMGLVLNDLIQLMGQADSAISFGRGVALLNDYAFANLLNGDDSARSISHSLICNLLDHLHGKITDEALALQLPPDPTEKKPQ